MALSVMLQNYLGKSPDFLIVVGALATAYFAFKATSSILTGVFTYFLSGPLGLSLKLKNTGSWAVVTGSTDGIGKAYAEQLAERGLNVVLISRTRSKLEDLAKDIENRFKVQTRVIAADFTRTDIYDQISKELSGLDIGTLVNNVGMTYDYPKFFCELENRNKMVIDMINCNTISVAMMTSVVLPHMVDKKKGVIINIASSAGYIPAPLLALYSGSKSFVDFFSRALHTEYSSKGITVQVVLPYFVATKMTRIRRGNAFSPMPDTYVSSALNTVGMQSRTFGFWSHALQSIVLQFIPTSVSMYFLKQFQAISPDKKANKKE